MIKKQSIHGFIFLADSSNVHTYPEMTSLYACALMEANVFGKSPSWLLLCSVQTKAAVRVSVFSPKEGSFPALPVVLQSVPVHGEVTAGSPPYGNSVRGLFLAVKILILGAGSGYIT